MAAEKQPYRHTDHPCIFVDTLLCLPTVPFPKIVCVVVLYSLPWVEPSVKKHLHGDFEIGRIGRADRHSPGLHQPVQFISARSVCPGSGDAARNKQTGDRDTPATYITMPVIGISAAGHAGVYHRRPRNRYAGAILATVKAFDTQRAHPEFRSNFHRIIVPAAPYHYCRSGIVVLVAFGAVVGTEYVPPQPFTPIRRGAVRFNLRHIQVILNISYKPCRRRVEIIVCAKQIAAAHPRRKCYAAGVVYAVYAKILPVGSPIYLPWHSLAEAVDIVNIYLAIALPDMKPQGLEYTLQHLF